MQVINLKDEPQHIPTLAQWHHAQWFYLNPNVSIESRIERLKDHLSAELIPTTFIATDVVLLGSAAIVAHDMDTRTDLSPWLASVFVAPEHRNKGIGSTLVGHVMQAAKQAGFETLCLFTPDRERFYRNLGWDVLSKETYRGYPVTVMHVKLNN